MKRMSKEHKRMWISIFSSAMIAGVLIFSLFSLNHIQSENLDLITLYFGFTFLCMSFSKLPPAFHAIKSEPNKIVMIKNFSFAVIYFLLSIMIFVFHGNLMFCGIASGLYLLTVSANRVCLIFEKKKTVFVIVLDAFLATIITSLSVLFFVNVDLFLPFVLIAVIIIMIVSILEILTFAFAQMQLKGLFGIMRKTYAFEVLYGLLVLVFSFSVYFWIMEDTIPTYEDALWYSFAVITTIGFGDFTVTSVISRILSVVLGLYGIVVVAVLTSVVVNFYNETKTKEQIDKVEEKVEEVEELLEEKLENKKEEKNSDQ